MPRPGFFIVEVATKTPGEAGRRQSPTAPV
jgi:hypothetical protein